MDVPIHIIKNIGEFQSFTEEMGNQSLMITQHLEEGMTKQTKAMVEKAKVVMAKQAKAMDKQAKAIMEGMKQQSQSQLKILEAISRFIGEARQQRHKVASGRIR